MLPGYALAAQGTQIHVAAWPGREPAAAPPSPTPLWPRQLLLSRAFASQAACYVIAVGGRRAAVPIRPNATGNFRPSNMPATVALSTRAARSSRVPRRVKPS